MKRIAIVSAFMLTVCAAWGQDLGLPDNSENKPAAAPTINTSYSAVVSYPSHSESQYFDIAQNITYVKGIDKDERRIEKLDSLVSYKINDQRKTITKTSLQGAPASDKSKIVSDETEEVVYGGRWCTVRTYVRRHLSPSGSDEDGGMVEVETEFVDYTDMETGIAIRQDQDGGTMFELSDIQLGSQSGKRFNMPTNYKWEAERDLGKLMQGLQNAEKSDNPAAAMKDLLKALGK